jgi:hypothetical protein
MPGVAPGYGPPRPTRKLGRRRAAGPAVAGLAPLPVAIAYSWISPGLQWRHDKPTTTTTVSVTGGSTVRGFDTNALAEYGDNTFTATLDTAVLADATALSHFTLAYFATQPGAVPRQRFLVLSLALTNRTDAEKLLLMRVSRGDRITITDPPNTWPASLVTQVVEGNRHLLGPDDRVVQWITSPVVGAVDGAAGPWFRLGSSRLGGTDAVTA